MNNIQLFLLEQIVLIPIGICLLRYKEVKRLYLPLFIYLLVKEITEIICILLIKRLHTSNTVGYNIMYLLEAILINQQFYKLSTYGKNRSLYLALQYIWAVVWAFDYLIIGSIHDWNIVFRVTYCFILVFVAISLIGKLAITVRFTLFRNTGFVLCLVFACWFVYNIVYEFAEQIAHVSPLLISVSKEVTGYMGVAEALMYIGCAWALYCIPVKKEYFAH